MNLRNAQTLQTKNVASDVQLLEAEAKREIAVAIAEEANANVRLAELALKQFVQTNGVWPNFYRLRF